jgi:hypothetical protein
VPRRPAAEVLRGIEGAPGLRSAQQLRAWLSTAARDADWAVVALRLATIELDANHRPVEALRWFDAVLVVGAPPTAIEDASARRVEALLALGQVEDARRAAEAFRRRWPASLWVETLPR